MNSISQQRRSLQQRLQDAQELTFILQQRLAKQRSLQKQGAISEEQVLQAEQQYRQTHQNISETQAQLQQLRVQETELQQKYLENLNNITQINTELEKLHTNSKQLEQNNLEVTNTEKNQIQELKQAIAQLKLDSKTFSGYKWSSSNGPKLAISPGTTTTVRVTVEERSAITFVLPILREWSGM